MSRLRPLLAALCLAAGMVSVDGRNAISASQNDEGMLPDLMRMNREPGFQPSPPVVALLPTEADFAAMAQGSRDPQALCTSNRPARRAHA